jgi:hypothetical protein
LARSRRSPCSVRARSNFACPSLTPRCQPSSPTGPA